MANVLIEESILQGWANAIREKTSISSKMKPSVLLEKTISELVDKDVLVEHIKNGIRGDYYNEEITSLRQYAFAGNTLMTSATLPNVTSMYGYIFTMCNKLISISLPNVTSMYGSVFQSCSKLVDIDMPLLEEMSGDVFRFCYSMKMIELPKLKKIKGTNNFAQCTSLESVSLPELVESADSYMFSSCTALKTIYMPKVIISNSIETFRNCTALEDVTLGSISSSIDFGYSKLLSDKSVQNIINALVDSTGQATKTIKFREEVFDRLSEEQKVQITSKNWTVIKVGG